MTKCRICRKKEKEQYLECGPVHGHIDTMVVRPPFQIFHMICIADCMVEFLIDLWQPRKTEKIE